VHVAGAFELARDGERAGVDEAHPTVLGEAAQQALASSSSEATKTSSGWPPTWPATSVPAKVVLNALATFAPGTFCAISWAAEPAATFSGWKVCGSTGLVMSTTTLPSSWPA
jgi:hypothetical protein